MIDHVSVAVSNLDRATKFYEAILAPLNMRCLVELPGKCGFGKRYPEFWLLPRLAMEPVPADTGFHVALRAPTVSAVQAFHEAAKAYGGQSDGAPKLRAYTNGNAFAAFVRDLDGNKIEAVHFPNERS